MEIGMKEDKDVADEISLSNLISRSTRNLAQSATKCTYLQFMVLEGKDCDKNVHEEGHGRCRQNGIVGFWVVRGHNCALSAPKHTYSQFMVARSEGFQ